MGNLRRASELAAQRKKRHVWRNVVTCIAAFVVFCTTYALILPAITLETQELSCGLPEHTHSAACYQLVCGRQEVYSHTHTRENCYDASGALTCTLREQIAHHHTQDCYSVPQPVCGQVEHAAHTHGETCYTEGALTCVLAETEGHVHTPECYPADFVAQLICGQQDLPEHIHTDACYIRACGLDEHTHTDACAANHREFVDNLDRLTPSESETAETAAPESTTATDDTTATDNTMATDNTTVTDNTEATGNTETTDDTTATDSTEATENTTATDNTEATDDTTATDNTEATDETTVTEDTPDADPTVQDEDTLLDAPMLLGVENAEGARKLTDVASVSASGTNVKYDEWKQEYSGNVSIKFDFTVAGDAGQRYIVSKSGGTEDCGLEFTMSLDSLKNVEKLVGESGNLNSGGSSAGTYAFEAGADGKLVLRIKLDDTFVKVAGDKIECGVSFNATLDEGNVDEEGKITFPVNGEVNLIVNENDVKYSDESSTARSDISVGKEGKYSIDGKTLIYTVTVSSRKGTLGLIDFSDVLDLNNSSLSITGLKEVKRDGQLLTSNDYSYDATQQKITISNLPKLDPNGSYTITYVYELAGEPEQNKQVKNTAQASSTPEGGGKTITAKSEAWVTVTPETQPSSGETQPTTPVTPELSKDGTWNRADGTICWKVTVNSAGNANVAGMTLRDVMLKNRLDDPPLSVRLNWSTVLELSQYSEHFTINEDGSITFNQMGENGENKNCYVITYYTKADDLSGWDGGSVSNKVTLENDGTTVKEKEQTVHGDGGRVEKKLDGISAQDESYHMSWKTTITLGSDGILKNFKIMDTTQPHGENGSGKHYFDRSSPTLTLGGQTVDASMYTVTYYDKQGEGRQETAGDSTYMEIIFSEDIPSNAGDQLVLTYCTDAKKNESSDTGNWRNKVEYRDKSSTASADITPPSFQKTDGNGQTDTTQVTNFSGDLEWKVKATLGSVSNAKKLTIVDTLPENVSVLELTAHSQAPGGGKLTALLEIERDEISGSNEKYDFSGTCRKSGDAWVVTLEVTDRNGQPLEPSTVFTLDLKCRVADSVSSGTFTNKAEGKLDETEISSDSQTQEWTRQEKSPVDGALGKYAKQYTDGNGQATAWNKNDQTFDYVLEINPEGKDIQPGSDVVYLVDEFSYLPSGGSDCQLVYNLVQGSVKLYHASRNENGALVKGEPVAGGWRWTADEDNPEGEGYDNTWNLTVTKYLRLEVPDSTPLILEYSYRLDHHNEKYTLPYNGFNLNAVNKAYFKAYPEEKKETNQNDTKWDEPTSSGWATTDKGLIITKMEEGNNGKLLANATFKIFKMVLTSDGTWQWEITPLSLTDKDGQVRDSYITDAQGRLTVKFTDGYEKNVLYQLVETQAPDGYYLSTTNPPTVKFYFGDTEDETHTLPEGYLLQDARNLAEQSAYVNVYNTPNNADFAVRKRWLTDSGADVTTLRSGSVTLKLMQLATLTKQDTSVIDPLVSTAEVSVIFSSNGQPFETRNLVVPKGSTVEASITVGNGHSVEAKSALPSGNFYNQSKTIACASHVGDTFTFRLTITHNVKFYVSANATKEYLTAWDCRAISPASDSTSGSDSPLAEPLKDMGQITLSRDDKWRWRSENLPVHGTEKDKDGKDREVWYSYYVVEESNGFEYSTSYSNVTEDGTVIGISSGTITVTNQLPPESAYTSVTVNKVWTGNDAGGYTSIPFKLIQKVWDHSPTEGELQTHSDLTYNGELPDGCKVIETGSLTAEGNWTWSKSGLLKEYNGKWYTYFIIEQPGDYTTVYSPEVTDGTITVTNTLTKKPATIQVEKQWYNYQEKEITTNRTGSVSFELHQVATAEGQQPVDTLLGTYTLSNTTTPKTWHWDSETAGLGLLAEEWTTENSQQVKVTYTYYVVELVDGNAAEKFNIAYSYDNGKNFVESNTTGVSSGTIIIKNTLPSPEYELPATGGAGTLAYTLAGLTITLTAALTLTATTRRKRPH